MGHFQNNRNSVVTRKEHQPTKFH